MKFSDIHHQLAVKERLIRVVKKGRIPHGILFAASPGSGAMGLAMSLAQFILCKKPGSSDSCGQCDSCIKSATMTHPDIQYSFPVSTTKAVKSKPKSVDFIDVFRTAVLQNPYLSLNDWIEMLDIENKQLYISVEESADILRKLFLKSYEGSYKIVLMWMPEKLRTDAANKLLKILEEPPEQTIFILISENYEQLIPTIRSRLQLIKIPPLKSEEILEAIQHETGIDFVKARRITHLSSQNLNVAKQMVLSDEVNTESELQFLSWMRLCLNPEINFKELSILSDEMASKGREGQKMFYSFALETIRECMIKNYGPSEMVRYTDETFKNIDKFSKVININNLDLFIEHLNNAINAIERNANPKILFIHLSFKIFEALDMR